jgi:hypothetical protein
MRQPAFLRPSHPADFLFAAVVVVLTCMAARVWWISAIVPGMDYPQFLVFVRAVQDIADPASPFHGTYRTGPWFQPTSLPIHLTSALSVLTGHSIEAAGKVLMTAQNVGLVAATLYLLKALGRPRWAILLVFPLIHSVWTVAGGFAAFSTSLPLLVLGWGLTVRWFEAPSARSGVALAVCLCLVGLWHGLGLAQLGLGFATLWCLWRAPSLRARIVGTAPAVPCLLFFVAWQMATFGDKSMRQPPAWEPPWDAAQNIAEFVEPSVPYATVRLLALMALVGAGLLLCERNVGAPAARAAMWRIGNPFLVLALAYVAAYFALPNYMYKVAGVSNRFAYVGALAFVAAWNLPAARAPKGVVLAGMLAFSVWTLTDIARRFDAFAADTRGASELIDRVGLHETLYCALEGEGASKYFGGLTNKPMRELHQFATIRHGGLPNSSFAGYKTTYVLYVDDNPMPALGGPPRWSSEMAKFDWVLTRSGQGPGDPRFRRVESKDGWELYGVCGSARFPKCS